jgi:uncharacterized SAM-binding protein YcdF (DUF218 family)
MAPMIMDWLSSTGLSGLKPAATALLLPPVPWLVLALVGAWWARRRPRTGFALTGLACALLWLGACSGSAQWLERRLLAEPPALDAAQRAELKSAEAGGAPLAIVVLGGGVDQFAPEYGGATLGSFSYTRLRYGVWLSRATGIPLGATGGLGWGQPQDRSPAEATLMARIAHDEFGTSIRWVEATSRDTRENAGNTVPLLQAAGVRRVVLVTHGWHMPRALREFQAAARKSGATDITFIPATMGASYPGEQSWLRWMPSGDGAQRMRIVLREALATAVDGR